MILEGKGTLLRIFIGESDHHEGQPLYEWIVLKARVGEKSVDKDLSGLEGFGAHSRLHTARVLRLSVDLPIVVEIVDRKEKIEAFLPTVEDSIEEGLATLESVDIHLYRSGSAPEPGDTSHGGRE